MSTLPTLRQVLFVLSHFGDFVVYYNELEEDFTRAVAVSGEWETVWNYAQEYGFDSNEVAEIHFEGDIVFIYMV